MASLGYSSGCCFLYCLFPIYKMTIDVNTPTTRLLVSKVPINNRVIMVVEIEPIAKMLNVFLLILTPIKPASSGKVTSGSQKLPISHIISMMLLLNKATPKDIRDIAMQAMRAITSSCFLVSDGYIFLQISRDIRELELFRNESCVDIAIARIPAIKKPFIPIDKLWSIK